MRLQFFVQGVPVPKGSAKAFMRKGMRFPVVMQDNAEKQKPWASLIALTAAQAISQTVGVREAFAASQGIVVSLHFKMPRPKDHIGKNSLIKERCWHLPHVKKPDLDKLVRLVFDALTGVVWGDDSQVVKVIASKRYGVNALECGVDVALWTKGLHTQEVQNGI